MYVGDDDDDDDELLFVDEEVLGGCANDMPDKEEDVDLAAAVGDALDLFELEDRPNHSIHVDDVLLLAVAVEAAPVRAVADAFAALRAVRRALASSISARLYSSFCNCSARSISACICAASIEVVAPAVAAELVDGGVVARRRFPPTFDTAAEYER